MSPVQPSLFLSKYNHSVSVNESFYDKKVGATQTDPDLAQRLILIIREMDIVNIVTIANKKAREKKRKDEDR